jgi:predicted phosphodiesterase
VIAIGDVHGEWRALRTMLADHGIRASTLIQVGDFGTVYTNDVAQSWLRDLVAFLDVSDCTLYAIRGNHDDPACFPGASPSPRLRYVADYTVLTLERKKMLFVGGAISVDRVERGDTADQRAAERFAFDRTRLDRLDLTDLWAVVTHTAPDIAPPFGFGPLVQQYARDDGTLLHELTAERRAMTDLYRAVTAHARPSWWLYGHFHAHASTEYEGTRFRLLDTKEMLSIG